jgi:hypothetical protein
MTPFDFVNSINHTKKDLMQDPDDEKQYVPFVVNRQLSYFADTLMQANQINLLAHTDFTLQYHFLLNSVRPSKRFSKWAKKHEDADLDAVKEYYGFNDRLSAQTLSLLTREQIDVIKEKLQRGGDNSHGNSR